MPFVVFRDPERHHLEISATGTLSLDDFAAIQRLRSGEARGYTVLFDVSGAAAAITAAEMRGAADRVKERIEREGPGGRFALVASDDGVFALAQSYADLCARYGIETIGVFRGRDEAERWLAGE